MANIHTSIPSDKFRVLIPESVYESHPPYQSCEIAPFASKDHPLKVAVFMGTYEECVEFAKENCKKYK